MLAELGFETRPVRFPSLRAQLSYQTVSVPCLSRRSCAETEMARGTCGAQRGAVPGLAGGQVGRHQERGWGTHAHAVLRHAGSQRTLSPVRAHSVGDLGMPLTSLESPFLHLQKGGDSIWMAELLWRLNETPCVDSILPFHSPFPPPPPIPISALCGRHPQAGKEIEGIETVLNSSCFICQCMMVPWSTVSLSFVSFICEVDLQMPAP